MTPHPDLPGRLADGPLAERETSWPVESTESIYDGPYLSVRRDTIVSPADERLGRVVVQPHGAVGALVVDEAGRILLLEQFRHPVGRRMLELPAGVLDVAGESPQEAAARELAEEADLRAATWQFHVEIRASAGYSSEVITVFRATDLSAVPQAERTVREGEEADMTQLWVSLEDAVEAVLAGRITNGLAVAAILAEQVRRSG